MACREILFFSWQKAVIEGDALMIVQAFQGEIHGILDDSLCIYD